MLLFLHSSLKREILAITLRYTPPFMIPGSSFTVLGRLFCITDVNSVRVTAFCDPCCVAIGPNVFFVQQDS